MHCTTSINPRSSNALKNNQKRCDKSSICVDNAYNQSQANCQNKRKINMDSLDTDNSEAPNNKIPKVDPEPDIDQLKSTQNEEAEADDGMEMSAEGEETNKESVVPQLLPEIKYEYLDHTADVQLHAWGDTLEEAFEQCAMAMFAYMTEIDRVDNFGSVEIQAEGHDMLSLLYGFLDEFLFTFNADPNFISRKVHITSFDRENFKITATGFGETFDLRKHPQGTEVKAITYSNMQFHESDTYCEVFVIIDI